MKETTVQWLHTMLWTADCFMRPTFRNLTGTYKEWAYRNGLTPYWHRLEKQGWVERIDPNRSGQLYRLTEAGRVMALGGRDPEAWWGRPWDGVWRMVLFDVPEQQRAARNRVRRYFKSRGFGYLQKSVWISPDPWGDTATLVEGVGSNVEELIFLEAEPSAGVRHSDVVAGAWDFERLNDAYQAHQDILKRFPQTVLATGKGWECWHSWLREEGTAWRQVMELDPLLPTALEPPSYLGRKVWKQRRDILRRAGSLIR